MTNILCLGAHPDDIELMAGGTIIRLLSEGKKVYGLTFTTGSWADSTGKMLRSKEQSLSEEQKVADYLGYKVENLGFEALTLTFQDNYVLEVMKRIEMHEIDTIIAPWDKDLHHDHHIVSKIAKHASRRIPRIIYGQINYFIDEMFCPNLFIDITKTFEKKIDALKLYLSVHDKIENDWIEFLESTSKYYGKIIGSQRAEGFITNKYLI